MTSILGNRPTPALSSPAGEGLKLTRHPSNPILGPNPKNAWESLIVTNPGVWHDEATGQVQMLYRAAGHDPEHRVYLGLATSTDGVHFTRDSDEPVLSPGHPGLDGGCVEDPRIVKMGDWYYVTYAARPFFPGQYWKPADQRPARREFPDDFPWALRTNATATYLALTQDFKTWIRAGRLTSTAVDDRDVILFPEKINGRFVMMHRPMNWVGPKYGTQNPAMWISWADDLLHWENPTLLAKAELPWEHRKIGGNTPPLRTEHGWLTIYHAVGEDKLYRLGAMLLDLDDPSIVRYRTRDWLLQPERDYELDGMYPGVCFPCGKVVIDGTLFVYYGGADRYVGLATCEMSDLMDYLLDCPWPVE